MSNNSRQIPVMGPGPAPGMVQIDAAQAKAMAEGALESAKYHSRRAAAYVKIANAAARAADRIASLGEVPPEVGWGLGDPELWDGIAAWAAEEAALALRLEAQMAQQAQAMEQIHQRLSSGLVIPTPMGRG